MVQTGSSLPFSRGSCARMQAMRCRGRRVRSSTRSALKGRSFSRRGTASMRSLCTSLRRDMASSSFRRSTHWKTSKICSGSNQNWLRKLPHPQPAVCHAGMTCIAQGYWQIVNGFMQFEITAFANSKGIQGNLPFPSHAGLPPAVLLFSARRSRGSVSKEQNKYYNYNYLL